MSLITFPNKTELAETAAETTISLMQNAIRARNVCHIAISGGGTPRPVFELWGGAPLRDSVDWSRVHVWWADERCVPPTDEGSNYRLASETFLQQTGIPAENIHRVKGELAPEEAARDYAQQLYNASPGQPLWPRIDLALLGMGADGHTASLFPGDISDDELTRPTLAVTADYDGRPANRVTLTPLILNTSRTIIFLATGARKASTLMRVLQLDGDAADLQTYPATRIQPMGGDLIWFVDEAAASGLK